MLLVARIIPSRRTTRFGNGCSAFAGGASATFGKLLRTVVAATVVSGAAAGGLVTNVPVLPTGGGLLGVAVGVSCDWGRTGVAGTVAVASSEAGADGSTF